MAIPRLRWRLFIGNLSSLDYHAKCLSFVFERSDAACASNRGLFFEECWCLQLRACWLLDLGRKQQRPQRPGIAGKSFNHVTTTLTLHQTSYFTFTQSMAWAGLVAAAKLENKVFHDNQRAQSLNRRAAQIKSAVETKLWIADEGYLARSVNSQTLEVDPRPDSSSMAAIYLGLVTDARNQSSHHSMVTANLTRLDAGIARYWGDPFFYNSIYNPGGQEVGAASPPWYAWNCTVGIVTDVFAGESSPCSRAGPSCWWVCAMRHAHVSSGWSSTLLLVHCLWARPLTVCRAITSWPRGTCCSYSIELSG